MIYVVILSSKTMLLGSCNMFLSMFLVENIPLHQNRVMSRRLFWTLRSSCVLKKPGYPKNPVAYQAYHHFAMKIAISIYIYITSWQSRILQFWDPNFKRIGMNPYSLHLPPQSLWPQPLWQHEQPELLMHRFHEFTQKKWLLKIDHMGMGQNWVPQ